MTPDTPTEKRSNDADSRTDRSSGGDRSTGANSMEGVDHTHPDRNTTFGSVFGRGPSVAADGGEPAPGRRSSSDHGSDRGKPAAAADPDEDEVMEDVDHEAPSETGANATFERGAERAADPGAVEDPADVADPVDGVATDEATNE